MESSRGSDVQNGGDQRTAPAQLKQKPAGWSGLLSETAREKVLISSVLDMLRRMRAAAVLGGLQQLRLEIEQLLPDCCPVSATCWYMPGMYRAVRLSEKAHRLPLVRPVASAGRAGEAAVRQR